jgi:hypothetical protein
MLSYLRESGTLFVTLASIPHEASLACVLCANYVMRFASVLFVLDSYRVLFPSNLYKVIVTYA